MNKLVLSALLAGLLAACSSAEKKPDGGAPVEQRAIDTSRPPVTVVKPDSTPLKPTPPVAGVTIDPRKVAPKPGDPTRDPNNILSKRSIFYEYDSDLVRDEFKPVVTAHSKYLTENRTRRVVIQGNTDERGSREYNLALGQRRADAVRKMMQLLGVAENQLEAVSFGEEKPRANGSDEAAFAQNRRSDIVYDGE